MILSIIFIQNSGITNSSIENLSPEINIDEDTIFHTWENVGGIEINDTTNDNNDDTNIKSVDGDNIDEKNEKEDDIYVKKYNVPNLALLVTDEQIFEMETNFKDLLHSSKEVLIKTNKWIDNNKKDDNTSIVSLETCMDEDNILNFQYLRSKSTNLFQNIMNSINKENFPSPPNTTTSIVTTATSNNNLNYDINFKYTYTYTFFVASLLLLKSFTRSGPNKSQLTCSTFR